MQIPYGLKGESMKSGSAREGFELLAESALREFFAMNPDALMDSWVIASEDARTDTPKTSRHLEESVMIGYSEGAGGIRTSATFRSERDGHQHFFAYGTDQPLMQIVTGYSVRSNGKGQLQFI